jgi:hypothetical protein
MQDDAEDPNTQDTTPSTLLSQLQQCRLTHNPRDLIETIAQQQDDLEAQWEQEPYITVDLDEEETGEYIQELLETALLFYFTENYP